MYGYRPDALKDVCSGCRVVRKNGIDVERDKSRTDESHAERNDEHVVRSYAERPKENETGATKYNSRFNDDRRTAEIAISCEASAAAKLCIHSREASEITDDVDV